MIMLATLVRWDWFKLVRRWIPWILLVILLLLSQLTVWGNYFQYQNLLRSGGSVTVGTGGSQRDVNCNDVLASNLAKLPPGTNAQILQGLQADCSQIATTVPHQLRQLYDGFTLPGSIPNCLGTTISIGLILFAILTASVFGAEYGWGTVRPTLIRGTGRGPYLAAKLLLLALLAAGALVLVVGATAISSVVAKGVVANAVSGTSTTWSHAAVLLGRTWLVLLPYLVFVAFVTVLTRSSASGMAIGVGYYLGEQIVVAILGGIFTWFHSIGNYLLGENIATFSGVGVFGGHAAVSGLHAFLVLLAYTLVFGSVTFAVFRTRDVTGVNAS